MTGWRIGYAAGPAEVIKAASALQSHTTSNPTSISQAAAAAALSETEVSRRELDRMRDEFLRRRDRIVELLRAIPGVECPVTPQGAFYVFPDVSGLYGRGAFEKATGSVEFARICLEEAHVAVVPGVAFGEDRCVRLSYASSLERIEEGMRRLSGLAG
jgi:aspartate aminotransferase